MRTTTEYRIRVYREGLDHPKTFLRKTRHGKDRLLVLLGPEPWKAYTDRGPDEYLCCSGYECGCGGQTVREESDARREGVPPVVRIEVSERSVTRAPWGEYVRVGAVTAEVGA